MPGYVAHYGVKAGTDAVMTISIFEDQKRAQQSSGLAFLYEGPPQITEGEVVWP